MEQSTAISEMLRSTDAKKIQQILHMVVKTIVPVLDKSQKQLANTVLDPTVLFSKENENAQDGVYFKNQLLSRNNEILWIWA